MKNNPKFVAAIAGVFAILIVAPNIRAAAHGPRDLSDGVIQKVTCRGRRLDMQLKTPWATLHLYTPDYFKVKFTSEGFKVKGTLKPCRDITGMNAEAVFYDVPGRPHTGTLLSVALKKK